MYIIHINETLFITAGKNYIMYKYLNNNYSFFIASVQIILQ